jgi:hypothetical protein
MTFRDVAKVMKVRKVQEIIDIVMITAKKGLIERLDDLQAGHINHMNFKVINVT